MLAKLNRRMKSEGGFTLIELLIVLIIIGILVAIAVPSYLGFRDRANQRAAAANVRAAVPAVEAHYADTGTYLGMTLATLQAIDSGVRVDPLVPANQTLNTYCIESTVNGVTWHKRLSNPPNPANDSVMAGGC